MFYYFISFLPESFPGLGLLQYITVRSFLCFFTTFLTCLILGPYMIRQLGKKQIRQKIRKDGPSSHSAKEGTPTMGGVLILLGVLASTFLWVSVGNPLVQGVLVITAFFSIVGYIDDSLKLKNKSHMGLPGKWRLFFEFLFSGAVLLWLVHMQAIGTELYMPFLKYPIWDLGYFYIAFGAFVIVGCANAVNLTDGLDGLAIMQVIICVGAFAGLTYMSGHSEFANYLAIPFVSGAGELTPLSAAVVAAGLGFLWYNAYPAQVFMGDVGSLGLGAFLGTLAVFTKNEILLALMGGVFVMEALSVLIQVISFKLTSKRVFRMAPLHHHFELKGMDENKIIVRFWISTVILAVLSIATLKIR